MAANNPSQLLPSVRKLIGENSLLEKSESSSYKFDPMVADINGYHIGIDVNTVVRVACVDVVSRGIDLTSGWEITA
ncbi:hypothetical protein ACFX2C_002525 [Malus domestica]